MIRLHRLCLTFINGLSALIHSNPAHVKGRHVNGISFHGEGEFHRVTPLYLPVVISVTALYPLRFIRPVARLARSMSMRPIKGD